MSEKNLRKFIKKSYKFGKRVRLNKINEGFSTENYKLTDRNRKYFVKIYKEEFNNIEKIEKAEIFFKKGGFPITLPITTKSDSFHAKFENRYITIYPFLNHEKINNWTLDIYSILGDLLGRMHLYSLVMTFNQNIAKREKIYPRKLILSFEKISKIILDKIFEKNKLDMLDKIVLKNIELKKKIIFSIKKERINLSKIALIHGDFHPGNIIIKNHKIVSIFDFEKCRNASLYYELSKTIYDTCFNGNFKTNNFIRAKAFIDSYKKHLGINKSELSKAIYAYYIEKATTYWYEYKRYIKDGFNLSYFFVSEHKTLKYLIKNYSSFEKNILECVED